MHLCTIGQVPSTNRNFLRGMPGGKATNFLPPYSYWAGEVMSRIADWRRVLLSGALLVVGLLSGNAQAQEIPTHPYRPRPKQVLPVVFFRLVNWGAAPTEYSLLLDATGNVMYEAEPRAIARTGEPYENDFTASAATYEKILALAGEAAFPPDPSWEMNPDLPGNIYTLRYQTNSHETEISYRKPPNRQIEKLTELFLQLAATQEFGRRVGELAAQISPQLIAELARMHSMASKGELLELQSVAPILQAVTANFTLPPEARQRAQAILQIANLPAAK
jgi:hypothetical protein